VGYFGTIINCKTTLENREFGQNTRSATLRFSFAGSSLRRTQVYCDRHASPLKTRGLEFQFALSMGPCFCLILRLHSTFPSVFCIFLKFSDFQTFALANLRASGPCTSLVFVNVLGTVGPLSFHGSYMIVCMLNLYSASDFEVRFRSVCR
jgi:hypothetical protein